MAAAVAAAYARKDGKLQFLALDGMLFQGSGRTPLCGEPDELLRVLSDKAGVSSSPAPAVLHLLARVKNDLGDFHGAIDDLEAATEELGDDPSDPSDRAMLAMIRCSRSAVAENMGNEEVARWAGHGGFLPVMCLLSEGSSRAFGPLEERRPPRDPLSDAGRSFPTRTTRARRSPAQVARDFFEDARACDADATRRHCKERADAYASIMDYQGAVRALRRLVRSGEAADVVELAQVELRLGEYDVAETLFRQAMERDPYLARAYAGGAEVLKRKVFGYLRGNRAPTIPHGDTDSKIIAIEECVELLRRDVELVKAGAPVDIDVHSYVARQEKLIDFLIGEVDLWKAHVRATGGFSCGIVFCACNDD